MSTLQQDLSSISEADPITAIYTMGRTLHRHSMQGMSIQLKLVREKDGEWAPLYVLDTEGTLGTVCGDVAIQVVPEKDHDIDTRVEIRNLRVRELPGVLSALDTVVKQLDWVPSHRNNLDPTLEYHLLFSKVKSTLGMLQGYLSEIEGTEDVCFIDSKIDSLLKVSPGFSVQIHSAYSEHPGDFLGRVRYTCSRGNRWMLDSPAELTERQHNLIQSSSKHLMKVTTN